MDRVWLRDRARRWHGSKINLGAAGGPFDPLRHTHGISPTAQFVRTKKLDRKRCFRTTSAAYVVAFENKFPRHNETVCMLRRQLFVRRRRRRRPLNAVKPSPPPPLFVAVSRIRLFLLLLCRSVLPTAIYHARNEERERERRRQKGQQSEDKSWQVDGTNGYRLPGKEGS